MDPSFEFQKTGDGLIFPGDSLPADGDIDETGEVVGEEYAKIEKTGDGEDRLALVDA